jgi:hypothetical protein
MVTTKNEGVSRNLQILPFLFLLIALPAFAQDGTTGTPTLSPEMGHAELLSSVKHCDMAKLETRTLAW